MWMSEPEFKTIFLIELSLYDKFRAALTIINSVSSFSLLALCENLLS